MKKKDFSFKSDHPACLHCGCDRDTYGGSRGLCISHYAVMQALVKRGKTTWEELEKEGQVRSKITRAERACYTSKVKRTWNKDMQCFVFVKK